MLLLTAIIGLSLLCNVSLGLLKAQLVEGRFLRCNARRYSRSACHRPSSALSANILNSAIL